MHPHGSAGAGEPPFAGCVTWGGFFAEGLGGWGWGGGWGQPVENTPESEPLMYWEAGDARSSWAELQVAGGGGETGGWEVAG